MFLLSFTQSVNGIFRTRENERQSEEENPLVPASVETEKCASRNSM